MDLLCDIDTHKLQYKNLLKKLEDEKKNYSKYMLKNIELEEQISYLQNKDKKD